MIKYRSNIGISSPFVARATRIQLIWFDRIFSWPFPVPGRATRRRPLKKMPIPTGSANESNAAETWERGEKT
jgi:hypothetical protein